MDFEGIREILWSFKDQFSNYGSTFISYAMLIGGIGAFLYIAVRVWGHIARAEQVDVYPLLRPFAIGLVIMFFPSLVSGLDAVFKPLADVTAEISDGKASEVEAKYKQFHDTWDKMWGYQVSEKTTEDGEQSEKNIFKIGVEKMEVLSRITMSPGPYFSALFMDWMIKLFHWIYAAVALLIETGAVFSLLILSIFGPISFGLSIFDGLSNSMISWISRYINLLLWCPIANVLKGLLCNIELYVLNNTLGAFVGYANPQSISVWDAGGLIIFYVMGIACFSLVPTIAGWIISGGGNTNAIGGKATGIFAGIAGAAGTALAFGAGGTIKGIASAATSVASSKSSERSATRQG